MTSVLRELFKPGHMLGPKLELPAGAPVPVAGAMCTIEEWAKAYRFHAGKEDGSHYWKYLRLLTQTKESRRPRLPSNPYMREKGEATRPFVRKLLADLGIPTEERAESGREPVWNGKRLLIGGREALDLLHECCHWQVAAHDNRQKLEYGLGSAYVSGDRSYADKDHVAPIEDEVAACVLGAFWVAHWGWSPLPELDATNLFMCEEPEVPSFNRAVADLSEVGLAGPGYEPRLAARLREGRWVRV